LGKHEFSSERGIHQSTILGLLKIEHVFFRLYVTTLEKMQDQDPTQCYICFAEESEEKQYAKDPMPCNCRGSIVIHVGCLKTMICNHRYECDVCKTRFHDSYRPVPPLIIPNVVTIHDNGNITYEEVSHNEHGTMRNIYTKDKKNLYHGKRSVYIHDKLFLTENYCHGKSHGPTVTYQTHDLAFETTNPNYYWRYLYYGQYKHGKKHGRHIVNTQGTLFECIYNQDTCVFEKTYNMNEYDAHIKKQRREGVYYMVPVDQRPK
jgi:hypothetical protein